ncbi:MAG: response regulator [Candidatus Omnitrophota bacterium]
MRKARILVIDDETVVGEVFISAFEEYEIIPAANGEEALEVLDTSDKIDIIVLDVMIPGLSGLELIRQMRKHSPRSKIVILSGYSAENENIKKLSAEVDEVMEKPFDIGKTKEVFKKLLK